MKSLGVLLGLLLCSLNVQAGPSINVGDFYDYLPGDKSTYLKRIFNGGTKTAFVKVNISEMLYKPDGTYDEVPLGTEADGSVRNGLIASPARLIVPADGMQSTRFVFIGERDRERYFRVRYLPVAPEKDDGFDLSDEDRKDFENSLVGGVQVMSGYGTVFFVRPTGSRFDTRLENGGQRYTLRNAGNTVIVVDEFKDCAVNDRTACAPTTKNHIFPGRVFSFEKQAGRIYRFFLVEGTSEKIIEISG
ncbi:molecular chaperone [Pseudomonas sp. 13B_2.1_Bac1]|uniref:molecular chaperone n=1 Tax=Pseudomonas sp. 13B_2.1_Bac1 TaxID=2971624 RepID=UPI0021C9711C|nr:molecular chaperone [Pseudomonas sp. 13B_2.1_Bac1]MCU1782495.1 molecular chaperone [Pseudomonas sp. 13B_2.1_Bac1]